MLTLTDKQEEEVKNKMRYIESNEELLIKYKALAEDLEYAMDDVEKGHIEDQRARLTSEIKKLSAKIKEIENLEKLA